MTRTELLTCNRCGRREFAVPGRIDRLSQPAGGICGGYFERDASTCSPDGLTPTGAVTFSQYMESAPAPESVFMEGRVDHVGDVVAFAKAVRLAATLAEAVEMVAQLIRAERQRYQEPVR